MIVMRVTDLWWENLANISNGLESPVDLEDCGLESPVDLEGHSLESPVDLEGRGLESLVDVRNYGLVSHHKLQLTVSLMLFTCSCVLYLRRCFSIRHMAGADLI